MESFDSVEAGLTTAGSDRDDAMRPGPEHPLTDRPIAAAGLVLNTDVALLAGASTIPEARRRGAQQALLDARLQFAARHGARLAMVVAAPGSGSQRNAERNGFRAVYTRTKWQLADAM